MKKNKKVVVEEADQEESRGGCLSKIVWFFAILIIIAIFGSGGNDGKNTSTTTAKPRATATATATAKPRATATMKVTAKPTKTPRPTKTPKPTATPVPDFSIMTMDDAVIQLTGNYEGNAFKYKSHIITNGSVAIDITLEPFLTEKYAVRDCCKFFLNVSKYLFENPGVESLAINFDTAGRDKYGNETTVRAMEIFIKKDTAKKINYEYMINHVWTSTADFLDITDRNFLHKDLKNGVY